MSTEPSNEDDHKADEGAGADQISHYICCHVIFVEQTGAYNRNREFQEFNDWQFADGHVASCRNKNALSW